MASGPYIRVKVILTVDIGLTSDSVAFVALTFLYEKDFFLRVIKSIFVHDERQNWVHDGVKRHRVEDIKHGMITVELCYLSSASLLIIFRHHQSYLLWWHF